MGFLPFDVSCQPFYQIRGWSSGSQRDFKKALSSQVLRAEEVSSTFRVHSLDALEMEPGSVAASQDSIGTCVSAETTGYAHVIVACHSIYFWNLLLFNNITPVFLRKNSNSDEGSSS